MQRNLTAASLLVAGFVGGLCANSLGGASATAAQETFGQTLPVPTYATSDSNGHMIAVTGVDLTGSSVLYLVDTRAKQIACYQATGGSSSTQGIKLIGARRIDLDLQLHGFRDKSEYSYRELEDQFSTLEDGD